MENKVYIFTECGEKCGYGHLTRCIALYDEISSRGSYVTLIINGDNSQGLKSFIEGRSYFMKDWYDKPLERLEIKKTNALNYGIIDSYIASTLSYNAIASEMNCTLYIDDTKRADYPQGIVLNPSLFGESLCYNREKGQEYLLGSQYIILRKEFEKPRETYNLTNLPNDKINKILIIMGGSDAKGLTIAILKELQNSIYNNAEIVIIKEMTASQVCYHMMTADMAISAAGQTIHELIACRLPFVCIKVAENQDYNVKSLIERGIISDFIDCNKDDVPIKLMFLLDRLSAFEDRLYVKEKMSKLDITKGTKNIVDYMLEYK